MELNTNKINITPDTIDIFVEKKYEANTATTKATIGTSEAKINGGNIIRNSPTISIVVSINTKD